MRDEAFLLKAGELYGFDVATAAFISGHTNRIWHFEKDGRQCILRLSNRPVDEIHLVKAEMEWLFYLSTHGVGTSLPVETKNFELVEVLSVDGEQVIVCAFQKASSVFWKKEDPSRWNESIFFSWGKTMGKMHRLTKDFCPGDLKICRDEWNGFDAVTMEPFRECKPAYDVLLQLIGEISSLPRDRESFGLIHYDMHPYNFLLKEGGMIAVFDFDDCLYGWFALDIGVAFYHAFWWGLPDAQDEKEPFIASFMKSFLNGYFTENHLSAEWLQKIPLFMRYRQVCAFSWLYGEEKTEEEAAQELARITSGEIIPGCVFDMDTVCVALPGL